MSSNDELNYRKKSDIKFILDITFLVVLMNAMSVNYTHFAAVIQTIAIFNLLYDVKCENKAVSKVINFLSSCTLGVYLLHDGSFVSKYLYKDILHTYKYFGTKCDLVYFMIFVILIFVAGLIMECLRKTLVKLIKYTINKIRNKNAN